MIAFIMDTAVCDAAVMLADGADLAVCESTFLDADIEFARRYRHLTARQAAWIAAEAGARKLVLSHFSQRYDDAPQNRWTDSFGGDVVNRDALFLGPKMGTATLCLEESSIPVL